MGDVVECSMLIINKHDERAPRKRRGAPFVTTTHEDCLVSRTFADFDLTPNPLEAGLLPTTLQRACLFGFNPWGQHITDISMTLGDLYPDLQGKILSQVYYNLTGFCKYLAQV
jgi:hypothetical protein